MGIITGYITLVLLLLLLLKFVAKRLKWERINRALMRSHKYFALAFLIFALLHFFLVLKVLEGRMLIVTISGIIILVVGIALTVLCHTIKRRDLENKIHRFFSLIMAIFAMVHIIMYFIDFQNYEEKIDEIEISEIDLKTIEDGQYIGEYDAGYIYAQVQVTVNRHQIEDIEILKHVNERGKAAEVIVNDIIARQKIDVDVVTHATNSSNVIKQACINALME